MKIIECLDVDETRSENWGSILFSVRIETPKMLNHIHSFDRKVFKLWYYRPSKHLKGKRLSLVSSTDFLAISRRDQITLIDLVSQNEEQLVHQLKNTVESTRLRFVTGSWR